ncbi:MAG: SUMF1/EgtB/PvdO family nonheme iron enzyme [Planctomycetota bacterium]|jgi:formylglycine-generating enzyme required for sulfatase activity
MKQDHVSKVAAASTHSVLALAVVFFGRSNALSQAQSRMPSERIYTNSISMKLIRIEQGRFVMGSGDKPLPGQLITRPSHFSTGDFDEHPTHQVQITKPFYMGMYQVTNAQYEQSDPAHKQWRGRNGYSNADDEAVIFVSWHDAVRFCDWLSEKEGLPYRLPTEAEWEYACRAGTASPFYTGDRLPEKFIKSSATPLTVGQTPPNPWGLYDMHGNVEEWCYDWYGPYEPTPQADPVGRADGDFKITRGGSHSTKPYYLRAANRSGSLPQDRQWSIGFRVVLGEMPQTSPLPAITESHQRYIKQNVPPDISKCPDPDKPYFKGPRPFVKIPKDATGPLYGRHNHFPAIVECPNGDLLAAWFTCIEEKGRELSIAASRLRYGRQEWEPASVFWDGPDRNDHTTAFWNDGKGTIYHFNGLDASYGYGSLAMLLRKSKDNGATWSKPRLIFPDHSPSRGVVESVFRTADGGIILPSDGRRGSIIAISRDEGQTWTDPGGNIRGIHAGIAQLTDGRLLAFGRKSPIDGKMPMSISNDMGKSWQYFPSQFQPLNLGQRVALIRLNEGPLFFASFCKKMMITDASGSQRPISGLFAAVSTDEGKTWPYKRLVSDDGPTRDIGTMDGHPVTMDAHYSEFVGYLTVCQTPDNLIHLLSSRNHFAFNLKWLTTPAPAAPPPPPITARPLPTKHTLPKLYKPKGLPSQDTWGWSFRGGKENDLVSLSAEGTLKINTGANQQCWWRTADADGYSAVDQNKGFTAEIRTQVLKTTPEHRGIDLELYDGAGSRYAITITDTGVYWYEGLVYGSVFLNFEEYTPLIEDLDNTNTMHTYRLAVREDRVVQIYRDEKLIGLRRYEYRTPRDAYILFGAGHGVDALVDYVAYDLHGPFQP